MNWKNLFNHRPSPQGNFRQSSMMTTAYLVDQNKKFEYFMRQKVSKLEQRVAAQQDRAAMLTGLADEEIEPDYPEVLEQKPVVIPATESEKSQAPNWTVLLGEEEESLLQVPSGPATLIKGEPQSTNLVVQVDQQSEATVIEMFDDSEQRQVHNPSPEPAEMNEGYENDPEFEIQPQRQRMLSFVSAPDPTTVDPELPAEPSEQPPRRKMLAFVPAERHTFTIWSDEDEDLLDSAEPEE